MVTIPVAKLVSRWTGDLKVGGSRPVSDTSRLNPIFAGFRWLSKGHFPLGGIFLEERHFLLFKDQLAESGLQKTKKISFHTENLAQWKAAL